MKLNESKTWNTGRHYDDRGQVIHAKVDQIITDEDGHEDAIVFMEDTSRGLGYTYRLWAEQDLQEAVMLAYDNNFREAEHDDATFMRYMEWKQDLI